MVLAKKNKDGDERVKEVISVSSEVTEKAHRRRFTGEYKADILRRADACTEPGEVGELLRKEGLYSSHLCVWRAQRDRGAIDGLGAKKRGPKAKANPLTEEVERLRRQNERLQRRLDQAELIIDVQKKLAHLLGIQLPKTDDKSGSNE